MMVRPDVPHAVFGGTGKIEYFGIRTPALNDKQVVGQLKTDKPLLPENERLISGKWGHRIPLDMPQHKIAGYLAQALHYTNLNIS